MQKAVLLAPGIMLLFALVFLGLWYQVRDRRYLLWFSLTCFMYTGGMMLRFFGYLYPIGTLFSISNLLFVLASILVGSATLERRGAVYPKQLGFLLASAFAIVFLLLELQLISERWFSLLANFTSILAFLCVLFVLFRLPNRRKIDVLILLFLFVYVIQFLIRGLCLLSWSDYEFTLVYQAPAWVSLQLFLFFISIAYCCLILFASFSDLYNELRRANNYDRLTGLLNRSGLEFQLYKKFKDYDFYLVIADLDHFKVINDNYGHHIGDQVLVYFSQTLKTYFSDKAIVSRWGGEEFLLILPIASEQELLASLQPLLSHLNQTCFTFDGNEIAVTASFGAAKTNCLNWQKSFIKADKKLYEAKSNGRNQLRI